MQGFQTLLRGCKAQYDGFDKVDYGFNWENTIPLKWAMWSLAKKIGFCLSIVPTLGLSVPIFLYKVPE